MSGDLKKVERLLNFATEKAATENGEELLQKYQPYINLKTKPKLQNEIILKYLQEYRTTSKFFKLQLKIQILLIVETF